ncbi:MAG: putative metallopeptidase [Candidatus Pacearchaeota archaeon]
MGISYELAPDLQNIVNELSKLLFPHIKIDSVVVIRSYGSSSKGTIARCHALGKAMQIALNRKGFYVIEVISKRFDKLSSEEKIKTLIHELMHIPKSFGGGFIHHNIVHNKNVERVYEHYINLKKIQLQNFSEKVSDNQKDDSYELDIVKNQNNINDFFIKKKKKSFWF